jgi:hypothetical protein
VAAAAAQCVKLAEELHIDALPLGCCNPTKLPKVKG